LTSLITHIQNFEVLSTKCVWSFNFILIGIQLAQPKLDSLALYYQPQPLFGSHLCFNINHPYSTNLQHFKKS
jgi:EamA domain-containing membrane protein RarD